MREGIFFWTGVGWGHACGFLFNFSKVTEKERVRVVTGTAQQVFEWGS